MALKTRVIVSEVNNLHDGRYCAGMGVDMIGFPLDAGHPHHISAEVFKEIAGWLAGVQFVGQLNESSIIDLAAYEAIDYLQTNNVTLLPALKKYEKPLILSVDVATLSVEEVKTLLAEHSATVAFFLLTAESEEITAEQKQQLADLAKDYKVFIGFGLNADNVNEVLDAVHPEGIGLQGGVEIKTGLNDFDALADVLEAIDTDEFAS
ncbi:N-(5'-phosphoribosyl)anthranilate isomerase [Algivirga pacifica]|uniref:phosphoribosylanthranilate isomerase n=1 Tax=Algivirga pacifica TaxID=1162670 RepID=A0ABP9CWM7_9BACT